MSEKFKGVASLDVDPQKGFTTVCPDELPVTGGVDIVSELNANANLAEKRTGSKDWHNRNAIWLASEDKPQFSVVGEPNSDIRWNSHCLGGEKGSEFLDGLPPVTGYDFIAYKGMENDMHPYGACYHDLEDKISTGLIEWYKVNGIHTVVVGGLAYDYCVAKTIYQLIDAGVHVILNRAATRGIWATTNQEDLDLVLSRYPQVLKESGKPCGSFKAMDSAVEIRDHLLTLEESKL